MARSLFDFRDGNGPVAAHQHPRGRGWVSDTAFVSSGAHIAADSVVFGYASVYDHCYLVDGARVWGEAYLANESWVSGGKVFGKASMWDGATILDHGILSGDAVMKGNSLITDHGHVFGDAVLDDMALVAGDSIVRDWATIGGHVVIMGSSDIFGSARLSGLGVLEDILCQETLVLPFQYPCSEDDIRRGLVEIRRQLEE
jgi:UDP-3-O-[3-hydroxymyristoyl] glucosamine N-acyltransferase